MIETFKREGIDSHELCERAGVDLRVCMQPDARIPEAIASSLWRAAESISGNANIGLVFGNREAVMGFQNLVYALMPFSNLLHAFQAISRHSYVVAGPISLAVIKKEQGYWIDLQIDHGDFPVLHHIYDAGVAWFVHMIRWVSDSDNYPLKVTFTHQAYGNIDNYFDVLGCPVEFNASMTGILIEHELLERPIPTADKLLADLNEKLVSESGICGRYDEFTNQVKSVIKLLLPTQRIKVADVAQRFGMSSRTFQRRLVDSGWIFRDLIDDVRKSLAVEYVCQDRYSLETAADKMGYKEPTSFLKNFKRWYGHTPGEYRSMHYQPAGHGLSFY